MASASDTIDTNIADSDSVRSSQRLPVPCATCGVSGSDLMPAGGLAWQARVDFQTRGYRRPLGAVTREDGDLRSEQRRVIERARINGETVVLAYAAAEHQTTAHRTGVAHSLTAARRPAAELPRRAAEANCVACESHERDESRAGGFAAIRAVAMSHE